MSGTYTTKTYSGEDIVLPRWKLGHFIPPMVGQTETTIFLRDVGIGIEVVRTDTMGIPDHHVPSITVYFARELFGATEPVKVNVSSTSGSVPVVELNEFLERLRVAQLVAEMYEDFTRG